jgi:U4/U6 small nuclear ribonucleoprotein PRP31
MRRIKERFEETELMKQANTRAFSSQSGEYGDDAMGRSMGMLDLSAEGSGKVRKTSEKRKMSQANTKASRKRDAQLKIVAALGSGNSNGLASSMVFTPVQGMELIDPDANRNRVRDANHKWFADNAGFQSALPKK